MTLSEQVTLESKVSVGGSVPTWTYCDYWGTDVSAFEITEPHSELAITARATVETDQAGGHPEPPRRPGRTSECRPPKAACSRSC